MSIVQKEVKANANLDNVVYNVINKDMSYANSLFMVSRAIHQNHIVYKIYIFYGS